VVLRRNFRRARFGGRRGLRFKKHDKRVAVARSGTASSRQIDHDATVSGRNCPSRTPRTGAASRDHRPLDGEPRSQSPDTRRSGFDMRAACASRRPSPSTRTCYAAPLRDRRPLEMTEAVAVGTAGSCVWASAGTVENATLRGSAAIPKGRPVVIFAVLLPSSKIRLLTLRSTAYERIFTFFMDVRHPWNLFYRAVVQPVPFAQEIRPRMGLVTPRSFRYLLSRCRQRANVPTAIPLSLAAKSVRLSQPPLGEPQRFKRIASYCWLRGFGTCSRLFFRCWRTGAAGFLAAFVAVCRRSLRSRLCRWSLGCRGLLAGPCWRGRGFRRLRHRFLRAESCTLQASSPAHAGFAEPPPVSAVAWPRFVCADTQVRLSREGTQR